MNRRTLLLTAGTAVATTGLAGCGEAGSGAAEDTPGPDETSTAKEVEVAQAASVFEIQQQSVESEDNLAVQNSRLVLAGDQSAGVLGDIENTSEDVVFTVLTVQATLYDDNDEVVAEFSDTTEEAAISELAPGEIWDFEIWFEDVDLDTVAAYSLSATGETEAANGTAVDGGATETDSDVGSE